MNRLILFSTGVLLALATVSGFPAAPAAADSPDRPAANPIVIKQYVNISVQATRGGQSYEKPMSFTIECFSGGISKGSISISCQSYPCKARIPVSLDTPADAWFGLEGTFDCRILTEASDASSIGISGYPASLVCGPEVERKVDLSYRQIGEVGGASLLMESYNLEVVRPCTVTLDLSAKSGSLFVVALLLAFLVEIPTVWLLARFAFKVHELKAWRVRVVVGGLVATGLTLPILWFVVPGFLITWPGIAAGELLVVVAEGMIYAALLRVALPQAIALSLIANAASFAAGLMVL